MKEKMKGEKATPTYGTLYNGKQGRRLCLLYGKAGVGADGSTTTTNIGRCLMINDQGLHYNLKSYALIAGQALNLKSHTVLGGRFSSSWATASETGTKGSIASTGIPEVLLDSP